MRCRVLLIEDDRNLADGVSTILRMEDLEVFVLHDGRAAVGMVAHVEPDVVVLDVGLGRISGIVVGEALRAAWPSLPIIFATGDADKPELREVSSRRRMWVLQKPYEISALIDMIDHVLNRHEAPTPSN